MSGRAPALAAAALALAAAAVYVAAISSQDEQGIGSGRELLVVLSLGIFVLPAALLALVVTGRAAGELDGRAAAAAVGGGVLLAVALAAAGLALAS